MSAIEVRGLTKSFGNVRAVEGLEFDIAENKVTGFLGPNGAGKTTTLRMILGLARPDAGSARVLGKSFVELADPAGTVGALLDVDQFHPQRSARKHLEILAAAGDLDPARVDEVLAMVELDGVADRKVGGFSLGMKQRLGLAAALMGDPLILILDEPANGLDPAGRRWLRNFLRSFVSRGRTVLVSSHLLAEVAEVADDVVVIDKGRLVTQAPVHELEGRGTAVQVIASHPERLAEVLTVHGIEHERISPDGLRVASTGKIVGTLAAENGIAVFRLEEAETSLEEAFFDLTTANGRGE